jgi:hypothetical protein
MTRFRNARAALIVCAATLVCLLTLGAPRASADTFSSTLTTGNTALSGFESPFAQVLVTLTSATTATVKFTSDVVAGNIYLMGDGGSVAVNVNATSWTLSNIAGTNAGTGFTPGPFSDGGAGNEDGFGSFNQTINSFDGFSHSSDTITFTLTNTSGGTWASAANVLTGNAAGNDAAAHIFVTSSPANASNGAIATGFAAENATPAVPEPASMGLLGTALLGAYGLLRRKLLG